MALGLMLLAGTLACYWPVGHFSFLNYDDDRYITGNPMVARGLSGEGLRWAFRTLTECNWHPLTWLSHGLDCQLFGLNAGAHHAVNLGLHAANVLLLFRMLRRLTGAVWPSAFAAALFGWHPMHVESVAWVSERKDVLSTFFFLLTLLAYARYVTSDGCRVSSGQTAQGDASRVRGAKSKSEGAALGVSRNHPLPGAPQPFCWRPWCFYTLALLCFALGLMSKPMLVTLPFVLLLLDYWPLERMQNAECRRQKAEGTVGRHFFILHSSFFIREKLPFFLLAAASCVVTYLAQSHGGAVAPLKEVSATPRIENMVVSYAIYVVKLFWPARLTVFYPWPTAIPFWEVAVAGLALATVSAVALWQARSRPWLAVGWFWFLGTLVPVVGLVQVGEQAWADRYTYIPYIGLSIMLAWGAQDLGRLDRRCGWLLAGLGALGLAACFVRARFELQFWQNSERLFARALVVAGDSILAHGSLAAALTERGELEEAVRHYRRVLDLVPQSALGHSDLGTALAKAGKRAEAEAQLREAIRLGPRLGGAYNNLGELLTEERRLEEAAATLRIVLSFEPMDAPAHCKLGFVWALEGDLQKAVDEFKEGSRLAPQDAGIQEMLAKLLIQLGGHGQALDYFLAQAKARPKDSLPLSVLARIHLDQSQPREAVAALRAALALRPNAPSYLNQLARVYATYPSPEIRNGPEAVRLAERACRLSGRQAAYLDTLSAAYAEVGRFADAVRAAEEARAKALAGGDQKTADAAARKLEQYRGRM